MICDAHFHVFGPPERYPYAGELRYKPPHAPLAQYLAHAGKLGVQRYVFVQPSAYGRDNACMLDAMLEVGSARSRGIVDIDENVADAELDRLHAIGVRGVRINVNPIKPRDPGFSRTMLSRIARMDERCAPRGWMLDFLTPGWLTRELLPTLAKLRSRYTLAHMGMFPANEAVPADFVDFARREKNCWVKLTGVYRISKASGFADAAPLARALIAAAPERVIWGSDYPHLSFPHVHTEEIFSLLESWAPDGPALRRILEDNPAGLFGF